MLTITQPQHSARRDTNKPLISFLHNFPPYCCVFFFFFFKHTPIFIQLPLTFVVDSHLHLQERKRRRGWRDVMWLASHWTIGKKRLERHTNQDHWWKTTHNEWKEGCSREIRSISLEMRTSHKRGQRCMLRRWCKCDRRDLMVWMWSYEIDRVVIVERRETWTKAVFIAITGKGWVFRTSTISISAYAFNSTPSTIYISDAAGALCVHLTIVIIGCKKITTTLCCCSHNCND